MLKLDKPQMLPLTPPYPLISCFGYIRAQLATLLVQNKDGNIDSFPLVDDLYEIDGQVYSEDVTPDFDPLEHYFKLDCNKGDVISWRKFIWIARTLFNHKTELNLIEIWDCLKDYGVEVADRPKHLNIFIKKTDDGLEYSHGNDMAFKSVNNNAHPTVVNKDFIWQVAAYLYLAPEANVNFLHDSNEEEMAKMIQKIEIELAKCVIKNHQRFLMGFHSPPENETMCAKDFLDITEFIQNDLPETPLSKNDILMRIHEHFWMDNKDNDESIWNFIEKNHFFDEYHGSLLKNNTNPSETYFIKS